MEKKRTTKQIIAEASGQRPKMPLYNPIAINTLKEHLDKWKDFMVSSGHRAHWHKIPSTILGSYIPRELVYTPLATTELEHDTDLGCPGEPPFTRGIHSNMYSGKKVTIRQLTGFGSPEQTNERMKFMLSHGATALNVLFDIPTIQK